MSDLPGLAQPGPVEPEPPRRFGAALINLVIPGAGLIAVQYAWMGFALSLLFCLSAQIALAGWLLAPAAVPLLLTIGAAIFATLVWVGSQLFFWRRWRALRDPERRIQIDRLLAEARSAAETGDLDTNRLCLESALTIDDEHLLANYEWARLLARTGPAPAARNAMRRFAQLNRRRGG